MGRRELCELSSRPAGALPLQATPQARVEKGETHSGFTNTKKGAVGHEYDVRLSTLLRATKNPALKGLIEPEGIVTIASGNSKRNVLDFNAPGHRPRVGGEQTIAEIIYWERPEGGRVFHTGSIATAWAMYYDESLSNLVRNVLHHFKVKPNKSPAGDALTAVPEEWR